MSEYDSQAVKSGRSDRDALLEQARQACLQQAFASAYRLYDDMLKQYPGDAAVLVDYGRAKFREFADLEQSAQYFLQAVEANPDAIDAMLWLALLSWMGYGPDYKQAVSLYQRVLELDPQCVNAYLGLGMLYGAPSSPVTAQDAIGYYGKAVQLAPHNTDAHHNLAFALLEVGETHAAQQELLMTLHLLQAERDQLLTQGKNDQARSDERLAQSLQVDLEQLRRGETVTRRAYLNGSSRFRWPEQN